MDNNKRQFYTEEKLSEHMAETPEGFLVCYDVPIARTGTQTYKASEVPIEPRDDGLVEIKRDEDEVFNSDTIKSFEGKTLCIDHPEEMVSPENWKEHAHGFLTNVRRGIKEQADLLIGDIVVTTNKAIELVKAGLREISCGYDAEYKQIEKGLGKQIGIIGNHIALVMRGRAGHRCAIGDKDCNHCGDCEKYKNIQEDTDNMKVKVFKDAFMDAFSKALDSIKDVDEEEKEKKEIADKKTKDEETAKVEELKAIKDKLAKDEDLSEEEMKKLEADADTTEEMKEKIKDKRTARDKKAKDAEDDETDEHEEALEKQVEKLTDIVEALVTSTGEAQSNFDKKFKDVEAKVEELKAIKDKKSKDAETTEEEKEKIEAKDCDSLWPDVAARADVLSPGIKLVKPTKDHIASLEAIKKEAIKAAYITDKDTIAPIVKIKSLDKLTGDSLDSVFVAASEIIQNRNNIKVKDSIVFKSGEAQSEIQKINAKNKEFWNKDKK